MLVWAVSDVDLEVVFGVVSHHLAQTVEHDGRLPAFLQVLKELLAALPHLKWYDNHNKILVTIILWTSISHLTQSAWFSSDCLWIAITFSLWKCQLYISGILFTMTSFLLKCLDTNDHEQFSGRLSIGGMPLGWVHFLPGYDHLRTVLLRFC